MQRPSIHAPSRAMPRAWAKTVAAIVLCTTVVACNRIDVAPVTFTPYPDVDVTATLLKVSHKDQAKVGKTTVVDFEYTVVVRSDTPTYFRYQMMAASVNGVPASRVHENTLHTPASHIRLKVGKNVMRAYAVFPGTIDSMHAGTAKFINLGLSRAPDGPSV